MHSLLYAAGQNKGFSEAVILWNHYFWHFSFAAISQQTKSQTFLCFVLGLRDFSLYFFLCSCFVPQWKIFTIIQSISCGGFPQCCSFRHVKCVNLAGTNLLIVGYWCDPSGVETLYWAFARDSPPLPELIGSPPPSCHMRNSCSTVVGWEGCGVFGVFILCVCTARV